MTAPTEAMFRPGSVALLAARLGVAGPPTGEPRAKRPRCDPRSAARALRRACAGNAAAAHQAPATVSGFRV